MRILLAAALLLTLKGFMPSLFKSDVPASVPVVIFRSEVDEDGVDKLEVALNEANDSDPKSILLVIDSPGGSLSEVNRAIRAIQMSKAPVDCVADGLAASAAFYMLESGGCRTRGATDGAVLLFHEAYVPELSMAHVRERDIKDLLATLRTYNMAMIRVCAHRMAMDPVLVKEKLDNTDWWMTSDEALGNHAVDYVASSLQAVLKSLAATGKPGP